MRIYIMLFVFAFCHFAWATNGIFPISMGARGGGRAGADFAVASDATAINTNPAGLGFLRGKTSDFSLGLFYPSVTFSNEVNDATNDFDILPVPFIAMAWDTLEQTDEAFTDPFVYLTGGQPQLSEPQHRREGQGQFEFAVTQLPRELEIQAIGQYSSFSDIRVYGYIARNDENFRVFVPQENFPIFSKDAQITAVTVKFSWRLRSPQQQVTFVLRAEQQKERVVLRGSPGKWHDGYLALPWQYPFTPAMIEFFTEVDKRQIEIRDVEITAGYKEGKEHNWKILHEVDSLQTVQQPSQYKLLTERAGPFSPGSEERPGTWILSLPSLGKNESVYGIKVLYHYRMTRPHSAKPFLKIELTQQQKKIGTNTHLSSYSGFNERGEVVVAEVVDRPFPHPQRESGFKFGFGIMPQAGAKYNIEIATRDPGLFPEGLDNYSEFLFASIIPAVAYRFNDRFSIGVALNFNFELLELDGFVSQDAGLMVGEPIAGISFGDLFKGITGREDIIGEVDTDKLYAFGLGLRIGFMWRVTDRWVIGAAYSPKTWMQKLKGNGTVDFTRQVEAEDDFVETVVKVFLPDAGQNGFAGDYDVEMRLNLPHRVGLGTSYLLTDTLLLSIDFQWIHYSETFDVLTLDIKNGDNVDLDTLTDGDVQGTLELQWDDQYVIAIGFVWQASSQLVLRGGYNYGNNPMDGKSLNPQLAAIIEHHITFGGTYHINPQLSFNGAIEVGIPSKLESGNDNDINPEYVNSDLEVFSLGVIMGVTLRF